MLTKSDVRQRIGEVDVDQTIDKGARTNWVRQCMLLIREAEKDRRDFEAEGHDLDEFLLSAIGKYTDAVVEKIRNGHSEQFSLLYGRELAKTDDHESAIYDAYIALRKLGKKQGDASIVFHDAQRAMLKQGKSSLYADWYAKNMNDEPRDAQARSSAETYERAYNEAREKHSDIYRNKYAEMMAREEYQREYCRLYARAFEKASMLFSDESEIEDFTEFFSNEFYEFSCRTDNPAKDEFYYYDRAIAYTDGKKFGRELGIANFADEYLEIYFSCFDDYPVRQDKKRIYAKNKEKARLKTIEYFHRKKL